MTHDPKLLLQVVKMAVAMRDRQKLYFRTRDRGDLAESKRFERDFDNRAKEILEDGPRLPF